MGIVLEESGMCFGVYTEENVFCLEKSGVYEFLGVGISTIEFILSRRQNEEMADEYGLLTERV